MDLVGSGKVVLAVIRLVLVVVEAAVLAEAELGFVTGDKDIAADIVLVSDLDGEAVTHPQEIGFYFFSVCFVGVFGGQGDGQILVRDQDSLLPQIDTVLCHSCHGDRLSSGSVGTGPVRQSFRFFQNLIQGSQVIL